VLDTNGLSLCDATFACSKGELSRRHTVDVFSTIAWFRALARGANATTVAQVARFYEPVPGASTERLKWRHKQWDERSQGRRRPSPATVTAAESRCAGSAEIFQLALWPALRTDWELERCFSEVSQLLPVQQRLDFESRFQNAPRHSADAYAKALQRRGTLDDLACLLVFLRQANEGDTFHSAWTLAKSVNRVLLLQAGWLIAHGLLRPLVEYVYREFFLPSPPPCPSASAALYFHQLEWLTKAVPRHMLEVMDGFDEELWYHEANLALIHADGL
jgi:hypothetical protein